MTRDNQPPTSIRLSGALRAMAVDLATARRANAALIQSSTKLRTENAELRTENAELRRESAALRRHGPTPLPTHPGAQTASTSRDGDVA